MPVIRMRLAIAALLGGAALAAHAGCAGTPESSEPPAAESTTAGPLRDAVAANPLPGFADWWEMGAEFSALMADAIVSEWAALPGSDGALEAVSAHVAEYLDIVYMKEPRASIVDDFAARRAPSALQSGEFDALSYAFYRSAFDLVAAPPATTDAPVETRRRDFTRRVGSRVFAALESRLSLDLPEGLDDAADFARLKTAIDTVTGFLKDQGYFRDHGAFRFDVDVEHQGRRIGQPAPEFVTRLKDPGVAHALFEMGYPVILPSAVYLFATVGEAQHHSSRTVEELFSRVGYTASETHDFDPSGYPADMVVELWEVRRK